MPSKPVGISPEGTTIENHRGYMRASRPSREVVVVCLIWLIRDSIFGVIDVAQVLEAAHAGWDRVIYSDRW